MNTQLLLHRPITTSTAATPTTRFFQLQDSHNNHLSYKHCENFCGQSIVQIRVKNKYETNISSGATGESHQFFCNPF